MKNIFKIVLLAVIFLSLHTSVHASPSYEKGVVKVLELEYYPSVGGKLDHPQVEILDGLEGANVAEVKQHVRNISNEFEQALELGSKYKGYSQSSSEASLDWQIVETKMFETSFPTSFYDQTREVGKPNLRADYHAMLNDINICDYVNDGVDYVWVWTWGSVIHTPESTMSGPHGNISNSARDPNELPNCGKTYVLLHLNYGRGMPEALHSFGHQLEAMLSHADRELFNDKYVGDVRSEGVRRCGNVHFPINGRSDYDYHNIQFISSDCEDWNPDALGSLKQFNCTNWTVTGRGEDGQLFDPCFNRNLSEDGHAGWLIYWMQNMPGMNNQVTYKGVQVRNWWEFVADFDGAMAKGRRLVESDLNEANVVEAPEIEKPVSAIDNKKEEVEEYEKTEEYKKNEVNIEIEVDESLVQSVKGKILLQVEANGEAWYVDIPSSKRYYLKDGKTAFSALRAFGLGISNADLSKIPIGLEERFEDIDSDADGLPDKLEEGLGTNPLIFDSDRDGYGDGEEVKNGFNPLGKGEMVQDRNLTEKLKGRIVLQVESRGEAWYINPADGKRYYMKNGEAAYQIMRFLSLGITNHDLQKIAPGQL